MFKGTEVELSETVVPFADMDEAEVRKRGPLDADEVEHLADVLDQDDDGLLKAPAVLDSARPEESPIHPRFTWDDEVAGEKWRIVEARHVITLAKAILPSTQQDPKPVRAYVSLASDRMRPGGGYRSLDRVMSNEDLRAELLRTAYAELKSFRKRYEDFKELAGVMRAIAKTVPADEE